MACTYTSKLQNLTKPVKIVSSNKVVLKEEIQYRKRVFTEISEYFKHLVNNIVRQERQNKDRSNKVNPDDRETYKMQVMLPYSQ